MNRYLFAMTHPDGTKVCGAVNAQCIEQAIFIVTDEYALSELEGIGSPESLPPLMQSLVEEIGLFSEEDSLVEA